MVSVICLRTEERYGVVVQKSVNENTTTGNDGPVHKRNSSSTKQKKKKYC